MIVGAIISYTLLSCDEKFAVFLVDGATWAKRSRFSANNRGLEDDADSVPESKRRTANQKCVDLELMLGQPRNSQE